MRMKIDNLALEVAADMDIPKAQAKDIVRQIFESIAENIEDGHDVVIPGFGKFRRKQSKERQGRNPKTGEPMTIKAKKSPAFTAAKELKERVNK